MGSGYARTSTLLDGAWRKFDWAEGHLNEIKAQMLLWVSDKPDQPPPVGRHFDPEQGCFIWEITDPEPGIVDLPLIVGDFLTNARACLDYLVWELAHLGTATIRRPHRLGFPIYVEGRGDQTAGDLFARMLTQDEMLRGVDAELYVPMIERHQPYKRGSLADKHPLGWLQTLVNDDKHRRIHIVPPRVLKIAMIQTPHLVEHFEVTRVVPLTDASTSEPGTEIVRVYGTATGTGEPKVEMRFPPWELSPAVIGRLGPGDAIAHLILQYVGVVLEEFDRVLP